MNKEQLVKNYISHTPNSGYVDTSGARHVFAPYGRLGRISTANEALQKELDGAIVGGAPFRHQIDDDIPEIASAEAAAEIASKDDEIAMLKEKLAALLTPTELAPGYKIKAAEQALGAVNTSTGNSAAQ